MNIWPVSVFALSVAAVIGGLTLSGCGDNATPDGRVIGPMRPDEGRQQSSSLLDQAMVDVQNPEQRNLVYRDSEKSDLQREVDAVIQEQLAARNPYEVAQPLLGPGEPGLSAEQEIFILNRWPATLDDVVDRLNRWIDQQPPADEATWTRDPMLAGLSQDLRSDAVVFATLENLDERQFNQQRRFPMLHDGFTLQQVVWMRDIGDAVLGGRPTEPLPTATQLFDWTVRNLQLQPGHPDDRETIDGVEQYVRPPLEPWRIVLFGEGTAEDRAWVFSLLARQQRLDVVMLAYPDRQADGGYRVWLPALWHDGEFFLYDPRSGLPVRNGEGDIATLAEVREDPGLLDPLRVEGQASAADITPEQLDGLVALIEGSPEFFLYRMRVLEDRLRRQDRMVLTLDASRLAEEIRVAGQVSDVRLWDRALRQLRTFSVALTSQRLLPVAKLLQIQERMNPFVNGPFADLWNGRVMQLKGVYTVDENRPETDPDTGRPFRYDVRFGANQLYSRVRLWATKQLPAYEAAAQAANDPGQKAFYGDKAAAMPLAETDARYWTAVVALERALLASGPRRDNLLRLARQAFEPFAVESGHRWHQGAVYNIARAYEAAGDRPKAIDWYRRLDGVAMVEGEARARLLEGNPVKSTRSPAEDGSGGQDSL